MTAKRVVLYARVSSERQEEGTSLDGQIDRMRKRAQERGYTIVEEIREVHTGIDPHRPGLKRLEEMAAAKEIDLVLVYALDRFMRDATQAVIVEAGLESRGVKIEYMDLPDESAGPAYRLVKSMLRELAQLERERIIERVTRGHRDRVKQGSVIVYGRPPYGYRSVKGEDGLFRLEIEPAEAQIVRLIFDWYVHGDGQSGPLTMREITKRLTEMGVPTRLDGKAQKTRPAGYWSQTVVGQILASSAYIGKWYYGKRNSRRRQQKNPHDQQIEVAVPSIIEPALWEAAQRRRKENREMARRSTKREYLLRRRVVCGDCGLKLRCHAVQTGGKVYPYYSCIGGSHHMFEAPRPCNLPAFRADVVDAVVWDWVKGLLSDPANLAHYLERERDRREETLAPLRERLAVIEGLLVKRRRELERALDLYLSGTFEKDILLERKAKLEEEIARLEGERESVNAHLSRCELSEAQIQTIEALAGHVREALGTADTRFDIRRQLVDLLDVQARLAVEGGEKVVYVRCVIAPETMLAVRDFLPASVTTSGVKKRRRF